MTIPSPMCYRCAHFRGYDGEQIGPGRPTCAAFPDEIPDEIFVDGLLHDKPYPGDHGIQFTPRPFIDWSGLTRLIKKLVGR